MKPEIYDKERYESKDKTIHGYIYKGITNEEEIDILEQLSVLDFDRIRIWKRHPYYGTIDILIYDDEPYDLILREMIPQRMEWEPDYVTYECHNCGKKLEATEYAWHVENETYCEDCAGKLFSHVSNEEGYPDGEGCYACHNDIDYGDDVWEFPEEPGFTMCDRCAALTHRSPIWWNFMKQT